MIKLRPYQETAIQAVRDSIRSQMADNLRPSVILQLPTGGGKTVIAGFMATANVKKQNGSVAFVCHRKELIDQTALTFDAIELDYGFIAADYERRSAPVQICSVGTLINRVHHIRAPKLVIWDECHHVGAKTWATIRDVWRDSVHVGLSATPSRLDGKGLGKWFNGLVIGPSVSYLMAEGNLSTYDAYAPVIPSLKGIKKTAGDYARGELESMLDKGEILGGIVEHWQRLALGKKTIGFAVTVEHSKHIVGAFRDAGISAAHLDAKTPKAERRRMLQDFARGTIDVIWNVDLFGEGFDLAANSGMEVTVECVIQARPTASLGLHLQQVGRALRPKSEPAIILDHAGNLVRHGLPDDVRTWSLDGAEPNEASTGPKQCPKCYAVVPRYKTHCTQCGFPFPKPEAKEINEVAGDLQKIVSGAETAQQLQLSLIEKRREVLRARSLADLQRIQKSRGLPEGWAEQVMTARDRQPIRRRL